MKRLLTVSVCFFLFTSVAFADTQDVIVGQVASQILPGSPTRTSLSIQNLNASTGVTCSQTSTSVTDNTFQIAASATYPLDTSKASYPLYCKSTSGVFVRLTYGFTQPPLSSVSTWFRPTDTDTITAGSVNLLSGSLANTLIDGLYGVAILSGGNSTSGGACTGSCKNEISNAGADISVIAGGYDNVIGGTYANIAGTIVGGGHNTLDQAGGHGFIGGGSSNICSGTPDGYCSIPGGTANTINGNVGTIAGGQSNTIGANAAYGVISGGNTNVVNASVNYGTITGGQDNTVSKSYATAIGRKVAARYYGAVTQAAGSISAQGDAQTSVVLLRKQTANNTPIVLNADGTAEHILIPNDSTFGFEATIVARDTVANESAMYTCSGVIDNNGGTVTAVAALTNTMVAEDDAGWAAVCAADDSINALTITVTGDATNLTNWAARVELVEVTG